ncbi:MAG: rRNA maturation RNase YbeY [Hyphomicrobiales bacterium]
MSKGRITFNYADVDNPLEQPKVVKKWINKCIAHFGKHTGEIQYIFCSDQYLLKINQDFLDHDTYTDIVTFDSSTNEIVQGELYISVDRTNDNAVKLGTTAYQELLRVIIHGVLHLIGFKDKSPEEAAKMREREDLCLSFY